MDILECERAWFTVDDVDKKSNNSLCEFCQPWSSLKTEKSFSIEELVPYEVLVEVLHSELAKVTEFLLLPFVFS